MKMVWIVLNRSPPAAQQSKEEQERNGRLQKLYDDLQDATVELDKKHNQTLEQKELEIEALQNEVSKLKSASASPHSQRCDHTPTKTSTTDGGITKSGTGNRFANGSGRQNATRSPNSRSLWFLPTKHPNAWDQNLELERNRIHIAKIMQRVRGSTPECSVCHHWTLHRRKYKLWNGAAPRYASSRGKRSLRHGQHSG